MAIQEICKKAIAYARSFVKKGSTFIENNKLSQKEQDALELSFKEYRNATKKIANDPFIRVDSSRAILVIDLTLQQVKQTGLGNCDELARFSLEYISDNTDEYAEIFTIDQGDHAYIVVNRDKKSDENNPNTWGEQCWICDPWANNSYPASEFYLHMRNYAQESISEKPHWYSNARPRLINRAKLLDSKQRPQLRPDYNSTEWRKRNTLDYFQAMYTEYKNGLGFVLEQVNTVNKRMADLLSASTINEELKPILTKLTRHQNAASHFYAEFMDVITALKKETLTPEGLRATTYRELKDALQEKLSRLKKLYLTIRASYEGMQEEIAKFGQQEAASPPAKHNRWTFFTNSKTSKLMCCGSRQAVSP